MESENCSEINEAKFNPEIHDLGKDKQRLTFKVQNYGIPAQTTPYKQIEEIQEDMNKSPIYNEDGLPLDKNGQPMSDQLWTWSENGKLKLTCSQPVVPVPIIQDVLRRDKIILVPHVEITDVVSPKVYNQNINHDVPEVDVKIKDTLVDIPNVKYVEKEVVIPIITGYTHKFVPKWEIHEVPRPVVKYVGEQKIVEVEVPEIKYVDKIVEKEVIVDKVEKRVPKIVEVPKYVDEVQYVWKPIEKIVYIQKLVPKFDVNLECPAPLIVPYPIQKVKKMPPIMIKKDTNIPPMIKKDTKISDNNINDYMLPKGSIRVPDDYINYFSQKQINSKNCLNFNCCNVNTKNDVSEPYVNTTEPINNFYDSNILPSEYMKEEILINENVNA